MTQTTTDIWLVSFLKLNGIELSDYKKQPNGRFVFEYNIDQKLWKKMKFEFLKSDVSKIKYAQEQLKDLIYN